MALQPSLAGKRVPEASSELGSTSKTPNAPSFHINDLPVELLSHIFILGFINDKSISIEPRFTAVPSILLRVCKRWHDVALATGRLWNNLSAPQFKEGTTEDDVAKICEGLIIWLSRSSLPLHLAILHPGRLLPRPKDTQRLNPSTGIDERGDSTEADSVDNTSDDKLEEAQRAAAGQARKILGVFVRFQSRWQSLQVILDDFLIKDAHPYIRASLDEARHGRAVMGQHLRHLKITLDEDIANSLAELETETRDLLDWISSLPELVSLSVSDRFLDTEKFTVSLFDRIKDVTFFRDRADLKKNIDFISRCKSAVRLKLAATDIKLEWFYYMAATEGQLYEAPQHLLYTLPNLVHLVLYHIEQHLHCLRCLSLPNLQVLDVDSGVAEDPQTCEILEEFFARSQCALKVFKVWDQLLSPQSALEIYGLPGLQSVPVVSFHSVAKWAQDIMPRIPDPEAISKAYQKRKELRQFGVWGRWENMPKGSDVPHGFHIIIGRPPFGRTHWMQWFLGYYDSKNRQFNYNQNYVKLTNELLRVGVIQRQNAQ